MEESYSVRNMYAAVVIRPDDDVMEIATRLVNRDGIRISGLPLSRIERATLGY